MSVTYSWYKFYEAAVLETDRHQVQDRVADARRAIQQRLGEGLSRESDGTELAAMDNALAALMNLEIEMLPKKFLNTQPPSFELERSLE